MKWQDTNGCKSKSCGCKCLDKKHFTIGRTPKTYRIGVKLLFGLHFKLDL